MGAKDALEQLEAAKAECVRLERENAALKVALGRPSVMAGIDLAAIRDREEAATFGPERGRPMPTDRELELLAVIERANRETDSYNPREAGGWQAVVDRVQDVLASVDTSALAEYRRRVLEEAIDGLLGAFGSATRDELVQLLRRKAGLS